MIMTCQNRGNASAIMVTRILGLTIGNGTIVGFFIMSIGAERVRDTSEIGFEEFITNRIVKAL